MNYKVNLGNVEVKVKGEAKLSIKDFSVEVTDFNLKDIPSIIKETANAISTLKEAFEDTPAPTYTSEGVDEEQYPVCEDCGERHPTNPDEVFELVQQHLAEEHPNHDILATPFGFVAVPKSE